jgi:SAM-dependent MidA family methyltransferase
MRPVDSGAGLRRVPAPDLDAVESHPILVERIAAEIERLGPMTFARFMELALYEPGLGYYRSPTARPGRGGDFLTAPEANPIFGRAIARHVVDVWRALGRPTTLAIREHGSGSGLLAAALLDGLALEEPDLYRGVRYRPVEVEDRRLVELRNRLAAAGHADVLESDDARPIVGLVIANEVLDALPTHRVVGGSDLSEVFVDWRDGALVDHVAAPSSAALGERLATEGVTLQPGQGAEICLALNDWVERMAAGLERGVGLLIDYGYPASELYDPVRRPRGTLAAYLGQRAHTDPYRAVGRQDLTAHVDTTAVELAATRAGLRHLATTTQSAFLAGLGVGELLVELQSGPDATLQRYLEARSALVRMIDPAAMGRFRVLAFGRGIEVDAATPLRGLG